MEKNQQQILSEIQMMISSIRGQLEQLDVKLAEWQQITSSEAIDISLDDPVMPEGHVTVNIDAPSVPEPVVQEPMVVEPVIVEPVLMEPVVEEPVLMEPDIEPTTLNDAAQIASSPSAVIDVMVSKQAWRTDMPGAPVKDVRGAIALVDRVLFINGLFGTDPMAFQETLTAINQMESLDEAVKYLAQIHPEWDFESEIVYRFMMAVRRKVN